MLAKRTEFELWALALMEEADSQKVLADLQAAGLDLSGAAD